MTWDLVDPSARSFFILYARVGENLVAISVEIRYLIHCSTSSTMKRFLLTVVFCASLLGVLSGILLRPTTAAENPLLTLLNLPAPPPPNPQVSIPGANRTPDFFSKSKPPGEDSSIDDLMDYWQLQSSSYTELGYNPRPSDKVIDRLLAEIRKDPEKVYRFLNVLRGSKKAADVVKEIYDRTSAGTEAERSSRKALKQWLRLNSAYFSADLAHDAAKVADVNEYVSHQEELLSLGRVDWERARPIVDRLYSGNQKVSRVLAQWALYRNALDNESSGDIERYREELKAVVEDKTATAGMRDLAFDALVKEKEWDGRDEWYYSLLSDETLDDLRVGGATYTGLTTIMYYSPDEKYVDRMVELVKSDNKAVRTAAAKNLLRRLRANNPEVIRALLPWLENSKWLNQDSSGREQIVSALQTMKMPESVPALIAALDEKAQRETFAYGSNSNVYSRANAAAMAVNMVANAANASANSPYLRTVEFYPLRSSAINALAFQGDPRAVPALRRLLNEVDQPYEQSAIVAAIFRCGGFTIAEQVDALEYVARNAESFSAEGATNSVSNASYPVRSSIYRLNSVGTDASSDLKRTLGTYIASLMEEVNNDLATAVVDRIEVLDRIDAPTGRTMRTFVLKWFGPAINILLLRDLKKDKVEPDAILRLLVTRKDLREKQPSAVFDLRTGGPVAVGISACLLEDTNDYDAILNGTSNEAKTAMLACSRLIRAPLPIQKVAANLQSPDKLLALAAERYLESEDSPEARRIVLSLHPNEAKILGATTAFNTTSDVGESGIMSNPFLAGLFAMVSPYHASGVGYYMGYYQSAPIGETEKRLQEEVKANADLVGVYSWEQNFIRIYKDKAVLSWEQDPARFRERVLTSEEFENFKGLLAHYKADELPPFLSCLSAERCETQELLMLGRNGGRRVFVRAASLPPLFAELRRTFEELRQAPSAIKYWASKDVPGLELLFADDRLDAIAVWNHGADFRLLTADKARRAEIDAEIEVFGENLPDDDEDSEPDYEEDERLSNEKSRREYENFAWNNFSGGTLGELASQPSAVEFVPAKDNFEVTPSRDQWKARAGTVEIRTDDKGLYKIAAGKISKIKTGYYSDAVITPNGRWIVATKYDDDEGSRLVRVNLLTNREYVIAPGELTAYHAIAFVSSVNRVIVGPPEEDYYERYEGRKGPENDASRYALLDPEIGALIPARGEVRPLLQQTFRALQPAATPFEFWAAVPKDDGTIIGLYNTRTFSIKPLLTLPKISFDSMDMWADEAAGKVYFVYEGHLLGVPVKVR